MQTFSKKLERSKQAQVQRLRQWRKHPFWLPIVVFFGLVLIGALFAVVLTTQNKLTVSNDTHIVIVTHDGSKQTVPTQAKTVGALIKKLNLEIGRNDRVEPSLSTEIVQDNFRVNIYRASPVMIYDKGSTVTSYTAATTGRSAVTQAGLTLYPEDVVTAAPSTTILTSRSIAQTITIDRSVPLTLNVYGAVLSLRTHAKTVGDLLEAKNVKLGSKDSVQPSKDTLITENMQVFVLRKGTKIVTQTQSIASPQQIITDSSLSFGTSAVRQQGSAGTQVLTYQLNTENGIEIGRTLLQTVVTVQPVPTIIARGEAVSIPADKQAVMAQAGIAASDYKYVDYIASHEGGWCPTKIQGTHNCPGYMNASDVPASGGYGIFQATPGRKMASAGSDWATSAVTQIRWATSYVRAHGYGSWEGAYNYWTAHHNW